ncbi:hypothetical protein ABZ646_46105, partial [Streptomyces sp. NPDC007162]|uniref:hypothetical protein n=1 Tax=Streptomyces sp. NPDC007162 TaxID=3156917 RepID=UPI0033CCC6DC
MRLADLLPEGWQPTEFGRKATILPSVEGPNHRAYTQPTPGVPALGLRMRLNAAAGKMAPFPDVWELYVKSEAVGQAIAAEFVRDELGVPGVPQDSLPFLAAIPEVDDVWGYAWDAFNHVAARPNAAMLPVSIIKNWLPVASRHPFDRILPALRPRTRRFLNEQHDRISAIVVTGLLESMETSRQFNEEPPALDPGMLTVEVGDAPSAVEHLTAVLTGRTSTGKIISQSQTVGMEDHLELDTADGLLQVPLLLSEVRHWMISQRYLSPEEIRQTVAEWAELSQGAYRKALTFPAPLPEDVLRESMSRILNHPAVRGLAPFMTMAVHGLPHIGRLVSFTEGSELAAAVGMFAVGVALRPAAHERLRELVDRASARLADLPGDQRERTLPAIEAARGALTVLAQDPPSAYAREHWTPHLRAADGERVALGEFRMAQHPGPDAKIVGVSSRPSWDDRQDTYSLLPSAKAFTQVRRAPRADDPGSAEVLAESAPQPLPFDKAYIVSVRGDGRTAELTMRDDTGKAFDYARLVDFLFATDPVLTALPRDTSVVVMGADVAGEPSHDPLEQP